MKTSRIFILVFGLVGLGMSVAEIYILKDVLGFRARAVEVQGEVVDMVASRGSKGGTMYAPRVRYTVPAAEGGPGASYEITGGVRSSSRGYDIGERVTVLYSPDAPAAGRLKTFMEQWFLALIFGVFATVFSAIALGFAIGEFRRQRMHAWLADRGMTVQARITEVARNTSVRVGGRSPWVIHAQWQHPVTRKVHVFQSENLWFDPRPYVDGRDQCPVRVDADNPGRYRVDIEWLPKTAD